MKNEMNKMKNEMNEFVQARNVMYKLIGESITYCSLLVGVSEAIKQPKNYESLILLGILGAVGGAMSRTLYIRTKEMEREKLESKLESLCK